MTFRQLLYRLSQTVIGVTFLFSGFVKGVDPMGSQIKFEEYLNSFGLVSLSSYALIFALLLIVAEFCMGFSIILGLCRRYVSWISALFLLGFTALTVVIFFTSPVDDCGCFGDAIKLTNGETLLKNVVLLVVFIPYFLQNYNYKGVVSRSEPIKVALFALFSLLLPIYAVVNLPVLDFLPYKVGVSIPSLLQQQSELGGDHYQTTLLYREKSTGKITEFTLEDTTWYNDAVWEYVDTKNRLVKRAEQKLFADFEIVAADGSSATDYLLSHPHLILYICSEPTVSPLVIEKLEPLYNFYSERGYTFAVLTQYSVSSIANQLVDLAVNAPFHIYNIDQTLIKSILRASHGILVVESGVIIEKMNIFSLFSNGNSKKNK